MGYEATDTTKRAVVSGLDALADAGPSTDRASLIRRVERARNSVLYEMNSAVAKQILHLLRP